MSMSSAVDGNNTFSNFDLPSGLESEQEVLGEVDDRVAAARPRADSHEILSRLQADNQTIVSDTISLVMSREHKHQGCQCTRKKMSQYNHRELPRLLKFHNLSTEGNRGALQRRYMLEVVDKIGLCVDNACPCNVQGIGCHHATCACTCTSNFVPLTPRKSKRMSMGGANDEDLAPINNVVKCSNKLGRYEYDEFGVAKFRKAMLVQLKAHAEMDIPL